MKRALAFVITALLALAVTAGAAGAAPGLDLLKDYCDPDSETSENCDDDGGSDGRKPYKG